MLSDNQICRVMRIVEHTILMAGNVS